MTGSIAVSQCGHTPNRPGHHGTVVARTVGTVAISCNASSFVRLCCTSIENLDFKVQPSCILRAKTSTLYFILDWTILLVIHVLVTPCCSSFTINIKAARDFCPDVICRHLA